MASLVFDTMSIRYPRDGATRARLVLRRWLGRLTQMHQSYVRTKTATTVESPFWMQHRLLLCGQRPISNLVDVTNYVMLEMGQPLHAFDYDVLVQRARRSGAAVPTIITRLPEPGEKLTTLDDVERELDDFTIMVADTAGALSLGGIMGGEESEISGSTVNVLLEAAAWDLYNIRRTTLSQQLTSEAGYRFSRGIHPALASQAKSTANS